MAKTLTKAEQQQIDRLLKKGMIVPPQPQILESIYAEIDKPRISMTAIGKLIAQDVGLSATIFKLVNSPFYYTGKRIERIDKAVLIIGLTALINVVKGVSLRKAIGGAEVAYQKFWERSTDIALLTSIVACKQVSACNIAVDQAYITGLFHDCGVPILMQRFPDYCASFRLTEGTNWPDLPSEDRRFKTDHAVVGYLVARHWQLPDFVCQAVRFHHDQLHTEHAALTLAAMLQMATHLYNLAAGLADAEWGNRASHVLQEIGLNHDGLKEFEEDALDLFRAQNVR